jgi:hypothetical protein
MWALQDPNTPAIPEENAGGVQRDAFSDALSGECTPISPDLATVINAWPTLPDATRQAVLAIVRNALQED